MSPEHWIELARLLERGLVTGPAKVHPIRHPTAYAAGTLRDKRFAHGPRLGARHAAHQVRIDTAQAAAA